VRLTDGGYRISHVLKGDSIAEVLQYVQYSPSSMAESVRRQAERALGRGKLTNEQLRTLMQHYEQSLRSYTYLTGEEEG
jgi:arginine decarboxylase